MLMRVMALDPAVLFESSNVCVGQRRGCTSTTDVLSFVSLQAAPPSAGLGDEYSVEQLRDLCSSAPIDVATITQQMIAEVCERYANRAPRRTLMSSARLN